MESKESYEVSFDMKKHFTPSEITELQHAFKLYDTDKNGTMNATEFKQVLLDLGKRDVTDEQVKEMLAQVDRNNDNVIQWVEFLDMFKNLKVTNQNLFKEVLTTKAGDVQQSTSQHGGTHSYLIEEKVCFVKLINEILHKDETLKDILPVNPDNEDIFHAMEDGILLCKLINSIQQGCIDFRAVNNKKNMNIYMVKENLNLALNAAKGIGIRMPGITSNAFIEKKDYLILAVLWQIMRQCVTQQINLNDCPELYRLLQENEEIKDLQKLPPENILIRWVNFHLKQAGQERRIANLGHDLQDSIALLYVLNQLDKNKCSLEALEEQDQSKRAEQMIQNSKNMGVPDIARASDIVSANVKINTLFVSEIFNTRHGLQELTKEEYEAAKLVYEDIEGTKEERQFRFWINSLDIDGLYINNLFEEARDGMVLLKVIHKLDPTAIDWKKVEKNPNNKYKMGINCNQAIEGCKKLKLQLPGIGGTDILEGNRKLIIAVVWQLVRLHYLRIIGNQSENQLVQWANSKVKNIQIKNFKDQILGDGKFLIDLCGAVGPGVVDQQYVMNGDNDEEKENNAKYVLSIARKLGAVIFCVWEDITSVNFKMILVLVCSLMEIENEMKKGGQQ